MVIYIGLLVSCGYKRSEHLSAAAAKSRRCYATRTWTLSKYLAAGGAKRFLPLPLDKGIATAQAAKTARIFVV